MISPGFIETSGAHGMIVALAKSRGIKESAARQAIMSMIGGNSDWAGLRSRKKWLN